MRISFPSHAWFRGAWIALCLVGLPAQAQAPPTPGPEHDALKRLAGEWTATIKSPDGDSPGTMTAKMECGGLWLVTDFKSDMGGTPFHGRGFDGYDPAARKHVSVWVDSMLTRPMFLEGTFNKETKTLTMTADGTGMDGKPAKFKSQTQFPDDDHHTFTLYVITPDGKEEKMVTIEYARKK
jgi:hypothetical protein